MPRSEMSERNNAIRQLATMGASYGLIGTALGVSRQRVQQIVEAEVKSPTMSIRADKLAAYRRVAKEASEQPRPTPSLREALEALELVKRRA